MCCKVTSYQSSRSFLVADTDLCLSVAKFPSYQSSKSFYVADTDLCLSVAKLQVTRVPEVFWSQSYESFGVSWLQIGSFLV